MTRTAVVEPTNDSLRKRRIAALLNEGSMQAMEKIQQKYEGSVLFNDQTDTSKSNIPSVPQELNPFELKQIDRGNVLGSGEFCVVQEVNSVSPRDPNSTRPGSKRSKNGEKYTKVLNLHVAEPKKDINVSNEKLAIKFLSPDVIQDPGSFARGIMDLIIETKILSVVSHPNIIRIRGLNPDALFTPSYFILLDYLTKTLEEKLDEWKLDSKSKQKRKGSFKKLFRSTSEKNKKEKCTIYDEKLYVSKSIASALGYLHEKNIIHRDVKPDNIGFDLNGEVKLFDFGLANELRTDHTVRPDPDDPHSLNPDENAPIMHFYRMTGHTGSRRYMAPEIAREDPYNEKADVYSFGVLFWEIMSLQKPFENYTMDMHDILVVQVGERPKISTDWDIKIQTVIDNCWSPYIWKRPQLLDVSDELDQLHSVAISS